MVTDLVSIILPTYNRAYCLPDTIESLLNQTYTNFEIIVIDDESTDNTAELFATRYAHHPKITYLARKNGGCGAARNTGIKIARGEFIAICDSDDLWDPWKLELQMACFRQLPEVGLIWTDLSAVDPNGRVLHERYARIGYTAWKIFPMNTLFHKSLQLNSFCSSLPEVAKDSSVHVGDLFSPMIVDALINIPTEIVRRTIINEIGVFDETMRAGEDYDFNLRVCAVSKVAFVDVPCIKYRVGAPDQLTRPELYAEQARNCIKSLSSSIGANRSKIKLSTIGLRKLLASKYKWLGSAEFDSKRRVAARTALLNSLIQWPFQPRIVALVVFTYIPDRITELSRRIYRSFKRTRKNSGLAET